MLKHTKKISALVFSITLLGLFGFLSAKPAAAATNIEIFHPCLVDTQSAINQINSSRDHWDNDGGSVDFGSTHCPDKKVYAPISGTVNKHKVWMPNNAVPKQCQYIAANHYYDHYLTVTGEDLNGNSIVVNLVHIDMDAPTTIADGKKVTAGDYLGDYAHVGCASEAHLHVSVEENDHLKPYSDWKFVPYLGVAAKPSIFFTYQSAQGQPNSFNPTIYWVQSYINGQAELFTRTSIDQQTWSSWTKALNNAGNPAIVKSEPQYSIGGSGQYISLRQYVMLGKKLHSRVTFNGIDWSGWSQVINVDMNSFVVLENEDKRFVVFEGIDNYVYISSIDKSSGGFYPAVWPNPYPIEEPATWTDPARIGTPRTLGGVRAVYIDDNCGQSQCQDQIAVSIVKRNTTYAHVTQFSANTDFTAADPLGSQTWFTSSRASAFTDLKLFQPTGASYPKLILFAYGTNGDVIYTHVPSNGIFSANISSWTQHKSDEATPATILKTSSRVNFAEYTVGSTKRLYYAYNDPSEGNKVKLSYTTDGITWKPATEFSNWGARNDVDLVTMTIGSENYLIVVAQKDSTGQHFKNYRGNSGVWSGWSLN